MNMVKNLRTGIVLFAHGGPVEDANQGVRDVAAKVAAAGPYPYVRAAFLEGVPPDLPAAVREAAEAGIERLIVIPYFLTMGLHMRRDLPQLVAAAKGRHPNLEIAVGESLEGHPLMPSIILGRVQEALEATR
jgi:sirohydrochlorin ferrochelatase